MFEIPEIMKTELFWAPIGIATILIFIAAMIIADRYRHPEIYSKKHPTEKKEAETQEKSAPHRAA